MTFPYGRTVTRQRAKRVPDRYSGKATASDWDDPDEIDIPGAFVAQTSSTSLGDASREQALEAKSLFCSGDADVQKGDRIRVGESIYSIEGIPPDADTNPFTGWTPEREIPLTRSVG